MKTLCIVSGGLDSTVMAYLIKNRYNNDIELISFDYGQRHVKELEYARKTAMALGANWDRIPIGGLVGRLDGSALTDSSVDVPDGHYAEDSMRLTVVPNRNMIMLSIAAGLTIARKCHRVAIGAHAGDHYVYPDCRPIFFSALNQALEKGNEGFVEAHFGVSAPFVELSKADIVELGASVDVPFADTWSCYKGGEIHCGRCGTCVERQEAFYLAKVEDPTTYEDADYWKSVVKV